MKRYIVWTRIGRPDYEKIWDIDTETDNLAEAITAWKGFSDGVEVLFTQTIREALDE